MDDILRRLRSRPLPVVAEQHALMYEAANEIQRLRHRWIPVTERLPPHDETVLFTCDLGPNEGFTDVESGRWEGARNDMGLPAMRPVWGDEDDWGPCSHWVPLPAPPTARK